MRDVQAIKWGYISGYESVVVNKALQPTRRDGGRHGKVHMIVHILVYVRN